MIENYEFDLTLAVDIFTIISALATSFAAFLTYKTLLEVKAQRESMYRPDLIIEKNDFLICSNSESKRYKKSINSTEKNVDTFLVDEFSRLFKFRVFNVGLATAKDIRATFIIDISKLVELFDEVNKLLPESKMINLEVEQCFIHLYGWKDSCLQDSTHLINNQLNSRINHILPVNILNHPARIFFPPVILDIYTFYIASFWAISNPTSYSKFPEFPSINMNLEYFDIGNKNHIKEFELKFKFNGGPEGEAWNSLEIKQVSCD